MVAEYQKGFNDCVDGRWPWVRRVISSRAVLRSAVGEAGRAAVGGFYDSVHDHACMACVTYCIK
jgi:hypothetical protein